MLTAEGSKQCNLCPVNDLRDHMTNLTIGISHGPLNDMVHDWNCLFTGSLWKQKEVGIQFINKCEKQMTEKSCALLTFRSLGWWWVQASNMAAKRSPVPTKTASTLGMSMQIFWLVLVPSGFTTVRTQGSDQLKLNKLQTLILEHQIPINQYCVVLSFPPHD